MTLKHDEMPDDSEISALYREASDEQPSPRHNAAILAAARDAVYADTAASRARGTAWWMNWKLPLAFAATVALTATLTLMVDREQSREELLEFPAANPAATKNAPTDLPPAPDPRMKSNTESIAIPAAAPAAQSTLQTIPREEKIPGRQIATPPPDKPAVSPEFVPEPAAKAKTSVAPAPETARSDGAPLLELTTPNPPTSSGILPPPQRNQMQRLKKDEGAAALSRRAAAESLDSAKAQRSPTEWIADIRALRRAGREDEALVSIRLFHQVYPDFPLPEDFSAKP